MSNENNRIIVSGDGLALSSEDHTGDAKSTWQKHRVSIIIGVLVGVCAIVAAIVMVFVVEFNYEKPPTTQVTCATLNASSEVLLFYDNLVLNDFTLDDISFQVTASTSTTAFLFSIAYDESSGGENVTEKIRQLSSATIDATLAHDTRFIVDGLSTSGCPSATQSVHVTIPSTVSKICDRNDDCIPVMCPLSYTYDPHSRYDVSGAPSNTELLFGTNKDCTIVKPTFWDEWVELHFSSLDLGPSVTVSYYDDWDEDGLSNIVEYYGLSLTSVFISLDNVTANGTSTDGRRLLRNEDQRMPQGSNPLSKDSDGDLLTDGFEWMSGLDMNKPNPIDSDTDSDGLSDFDEQKYRTNPLVPDSDFDGKSDKLEVSQGSDPTDDTNSVADPYTVQVQLEIGDPSGSHSERWGLKVGSVVHSAPTYGEMGSGTYTMRTGVHTITIQHQGSNLATPDYDYRANIYPASSTSVTVTIEDPEQILGNHGESSYNYAAGKFATLRIERVDEKCTHKTCRTCNADSNCYWSSNNRACFEHRLMTAQQSVSDCACEKCKTWAEEEMKDLSWIEDLVKCPRQVEMREDEIIVKDGKNWGADKACYPGGYIFNCYFHPEEVDQGYPGATGCIRLDGQQCCYDADGNLNTRGRGAGTPDITNVFFDHFSLDMIPYYRCCEYCEEYEICELYIGGENKPGARSDPRSRECEKQSMYNKYEYSKCRMNSKHASVYFDKVDRAM